MNPSTPGPRTPTSRSGSATSAPTSIVGSAATGGCRRGPPRRRGPPDRRAHRDPRRLLQLAAAILVVTLAGLAALPPTREAIADWLGVGGVRITQTDRPPPTGGPDRPPSPTLRRRPSTRAADLSFERAPGRPGAGRAPARGGSSTLGWPRASWRSATALHAGPAGVGAGRTARSLEKFVDRGTSVRSATVDGHDGFWLSGEPHEIGFIGPDGRLDADSVRRAGNVLVWEDAGVTYRIEGLETPRCGAQAGRSAPLSGTPGSRAV